MARKTELLKNTMISEINLTPLMDLTFILLITFIITFPLIETGMPVNLPTSRGKAMEEKDTVPVTVDEDGNWFFDKRAVNKEQFAAEIRYIKESRPDAVILLRGDKGLPYGSLMDVMQALQDNGIKRISLVTQSGEPVRIP
jgi:biopolymer transport protein TolR